LEWQYERRLWLYLQLSLCFPSKEAQSDNSELVEAKTTEFFIRLGNLREEGVQNITSCQSCLSRHDFELYPKFSRIITSAQLLHRPWQCFYVFLLQQLPNPFYLLRIGLHPSQYQLIPIIHAKVRKQLFSSALLGHNMVS